MDRFSNRSNQKRWTLLWRWAPSEYATISLVWFACPYRDTHSTLVTYKLYNVQYSTGVDLSKRTRIHWYEGIEWTNEHTNAKKHRYQRTTDIDLSYVSQPIVCVGANVWNAFERVVVCCSCVLTERECMRSSIPFNSHLKSLTKWNESRCEHTHMALMLCVKRIHERRLRTQPHAARIGLSMQCCNIQ